MHILFGCQAKLKGCNFYISHGLFIHRHVQIYICIYIYKFTDTHVHTHKHTHACVENFVMWQMQLKCLQAFCRFMARLAGKIPPVPPPTPLSLIGMLPASQTPPTLACHWQLHATFCF